MNDTDRSGGHLLPLSFSGVATTDAAAPPARIRPRRRGLWITVAAVPILAGLIGGGHLWANLQYDEAAAAFSASASETISLHRDLERFLRESDGVLDAAALISEADSGLLTTAAVREAFESALDDTGARFSDAADAASVPLPAPRRSRSGPGSSSPAPARSRRRRWRRGSTQGRWTRPGNRWSSASRCSMRRPRTCSTPRPMPPRRSKRRTRRP
ncbi:hypothetical protein [Microbacterium sp. NIBRBAC000506063]|uniref:hypothetical protein n=1 Tax=Microbacterium sp. NIBRBAC000506063 TaxID=2734618 RepID=UPI001BB6E090|nr:hypothetical protein [Microbacterium sp. NIBRBAC000506063]QTV80982.1 hypothetical protein KAE78_14775 [Microbacterium sp. NIBRBAC000506063]